MSTSGEPTIFGQEPAVILGFASAVIGLIVTLNVGVSENWGVAITAGVSGVLSLVVGLMTRPITPAVFTGFVAVLGDVATKFGYHFSLGVVGAVNAVIMCGFMFHARGHVTPVATMNAMYVAQTRNGVKSGR